MSAAYWLGCAVVRGALRVPPLARCLTVASRVWNRHAKLYAHLRHGQYDGVIDGGANIGEFAGLARAALPHADLVCIEPHPACAASLRKAGYRVIEAALWNSPGSLKLSQPAQATTSCSVLPHDLSIHSWTVEALRLDQIAIAGRRLLLKLDLQGAEVEALKGMGDLWNRCEALLLEVSLGENGTYPVLQDLLQSKGFSEHSTVNELEVEGQVVEADKLWTRLPAASNP